MKETALMEWVNSESGGAERKARKELRDKIYKIVSTARPSGEGPSAVADELSFAIAEYVLEGICGNEFKREK